ncbi:MAG: hypothetical protein ACXWB2_14925 [Acidimicrobiales bacterium]
MAGADVAPDAGQARQDEDTPIERVRRQEPGESLEESSDLLLAGVARPSPKPRLAWWLRKHDA